MTKFIKKIQFLFSIPLALLPAQFFSCSKTAPVSPKTHKIFVSDQDGKTNFAISPDSTYIEGELRYVGITDSTQDEEITGIEKAWVVVSGSEMVLTPQTDYHVQQLRPDKIQIKEFNQEKMIGDLYFLVTTKYVPPEKKHNIIVDTQDVTSEVEQIVEGDSLNTKLNLSTVQDTMEIDDIIYIKIGEKTLTITDFYFDYDTTTLTIDNPALIIDDVHIAVRITKKKYKITVNTTGPASVVVSSSVKETRNHEPLSTMLSILFKSNPVLSFGDISVLVGGVELAKDQYHFDINWTQPTTGTLAIEDQSLIKNDIQINANVEQIEPIEKNVFFCDGINTVKSPFTANNITGFFQDNITTFYWNYFWNDKTKAVDRLAIDIDDDGRTKRLVEGVDYVFQNDQLLINPAAVTGNIKIYEYVRNLSSETLATDKWEYIAHWIQCSRGLPDTTEGQFLIELYHPTDDNFVGLVNEETFNFQYGSKEVDHPYRFRVIGQNEDTISEFSEHYNPKKPKKAFLTLQIDRPIKNEEEDPCDIKFNLYPPEIPNGKQALWTEDNPAYKAITETVPKLAPAWTKQVIQKVKKQRYVSGPDLAQQTDETFFLPSWAEVGQGETFYDDHPWWGLMYGGDGHLNDEGESVSYSYFTGDAKDVTKKRKELLNLPETNFMYLTTPSNRTSLTSCSYFGGSGYDGKGSVQRGDYEEEGKPLLPSMFYFMWCLCI